MQRILLLAILLVTTVSAQALLPAYQNSTDTELRAALIPWSWHVTPNVIAPGRCQDASRTLGMFAAINVVGTIFALVVGYQPIAHRVSFGLWAHPDSKAWFLTVPIQLGLHVGGAYLNALIVSRSKNYDDVPVTPLALLFLARPRLAWIFLMFLIRQKPYRNAATATLISEVILQFFGAITMGRTAQFASQHNYYNPSHHNFPHGSDAYMMYCGAVVFLAFMIASLVGAIIGLVLYYDNSHKLSELSFKRAVLAAVALFCLLFTWIGSWLFWAGFIKLAGPL
jgi:hypothetical protein